MSTVEHSRRRRSRSAATTFGARTPWFRTAAACMIGLPLIGSAYLVCFAPGAGAQVDYPGPGGGGGGGGGGDDDDDDDDGLSGGEIAAIAIGGVAVIALATGAFSGGAAGAASGAFPIGAATECADKYPALPSDQTRITEIRISPSDTRIERGYARCFYLEVKAEDGKWYAVTQRNETTFALKEPDICLTKMDGVKNVFMVPMSTPQSCDGKTVQVVGTFAPAGQSPYTATANVRIKVPNN